MPMTIMLAEMAGFDLQPDTIYLETVSREIRESGGRIASFVDHRMIASWGVPVADPQHAVNACRAALACRRAAKLCGLTDDGGSRAGVRIGIDSSDGLTRGGGDTFRLASEAMLTSGATAGRVRSIGDEYGADITLTDATRVTAGRAIVVRELDIIAVQGPGRGRIYELVAMADQAATEPNWVTLYNAGLEAYRKRRFETALGLFQMVLVVREGDRAARLMIDRCYQCIEAVPDAGSQAASVMDPK